MKAGAFCRDKDWGQPYGIGPDLRGRRLDFKNCKEKTATCSPNGSITLTMSSTTLVNSCVGPK